ncbi:LysR family transcriptional regulator [Achromobacter denitrificans]|uniref:LysR family transcriptional regulator n=1 Tax=Achromobacter denitrificans TaxID=32002 RepID=UPI000F4EADC0|nr:LysR substrate-binding domain-containing protein [Achromobacter denitrificans]MBV2161783.1 LysR family transcriptional regulator [Achromobacter denitrificans]MDX3880457.1 LysR substrate-binding domain-containing protein [Achromobacter sp.]QCS61450.1 LysR family transcriptional regulator [Achromobacter denitrificans]WFC66753.1 LysR family transcriptional regulator [Achromobacter denitrificans]
MDVAPATLLARLLAKGRLRHLQLLAGIADLGSIQQAASHIGMSQPAATHALADIEALLGVRLFERHARGMRATRSGRLMAECAQGMLTTLRASTDSVAALRQGATGYLRLGAIPAASGGLLAERLPAYMTGHPGMQVEIIEGSREQLLPQAANGSLDMLLCRQPDAVPTGLEFVPLQQDEAVIVAAAGHPLLAADPAPTAAQVASQLWIEPRPELAIHAVFKAYFERAGVVPRLCRLASAAPPMPLLIAVMQAQQALAMVPLTLADWYVQHGHFQRLRVASPGSFQPIGAIVGERGPGRDFLEWLRRRGRPAALQACEP